MEIGYFGTELNTHGHYLWTMSDERQLYDKNINLECLPFNPEDMPRRDKGETRTKGAVEFYQEHGYSILAIEGSCIDTRWGTKSVFFVKENISKAELITIIKAIPIAVEIINAMPFEVNLNL